MGRGGVAELEIEVGLPVRPRESGTGATIKHAVSATDLSRIFGKNETKAEYLRLVAPDVRMPKSPSTERIDTAMVEHWDYERECEQIRKLFRTSDKYEESLRAEAAMEMYRQMMIDEGFDPETWPYSARNYQQEMKKIMRQYPDDVHAGLDACDRANRHFNLRTEFTTARNNLIERLMFDSHPEIVPTLTHSKGTDFYIDGVAYDQKVSKSVGGEFKTKYGDRWREKALERPDLVAKSLYEHQDSGRWDADRRLYVVALDEDVTAEEIERQVAAFDFSTPYQVSFSKDGKPGKVYRTECFVLLLHRERETACQLAEAC